ncbi:DUF616 domain-containing protein [Ramlibacter terrae]|uniref:DUF616 domain-containing protein n=1 Tax=Ramlibacter terrae TaxID=2732511 RepID=A0ABX6P4N5_9BURK|nr:DUF616 domain-containing protein [Ramlibacter terrae]
MRLLVYTCVFGGYDRVYPPLHADPAVDHVLVTDDARTRVAGWRTVLADRSRFAGSQAANRYYKMLAHREFPGYDASLYADGNIRLLGRTAEFVAPFLRSGAALGAYRHPLRDTVAAEIEACLAEGKLRERTAVDAEWAAYRAEGFADDRGLVEATILMKNHAHPALDAAMQLWWEQFERYGTRDQ